MMQTSRVSIITYNRSRAYKVVTYKLCPSEGPCLLRSCATAQPCDPAKLHTVHRPARPSITIAHLMVTLDLPSALWLSLALASIYTIRIIKRHTPHKLPPGPRGLPFFGPLFQLSVTPWKEFETWKAQYGKPTALSRLKSSFHP